MWGGGGGACVGQEGGELGGLCVCGGGACVGQEGGELGVCVGGVHVWVSKGVSWEVVGGGELGGCVCVCVWGGGVHVWVRKGVSWEVVCVWGGCMCGSGRG